MKFMFLTTIKLYTMWSYFWKIKTKDGCSTNSSFRQSKTTALRQSIYQEQEEKPAIALENDMGKLVRGEKTLESATTVWWGGYLGEQQVILSIHGGQLAIGSGQVSFHTTKIMFSYRPTMENENNVYQWTKWRNMHLSLS